MDALTLALRQCGRRIAIDRAAESRAAAYEALAALTRLCDRDVDVVIAATDMETIEEPPHGDA